MAGEREAHGFDYSNVPGITEFKASVRFNPDNTEYLNPYISDRAARAKDLAEQPVTFPLNMDDRLKPGTADQDLVLTPFDQFDGMELDALDEEHVEAWQKQLEFNLRLSNSPVRVWAMEQVEQRGFVPPTPVKTPIERELAEGKILQLPDVGHSSEARRAIEFLHASPEERQELLKEAEKRSQVHRTELLATGVFTYWGDQARSYFGMGAMPDTNGSALMIRTAAKSHVPIGIPEVGSFSDPERSAALAKEALDGLTVDDPLLAQYPPELRQKMVERWRGNVVGVLEITKDKSFKRYEALRNAGVTTFRLYGHTQGFDVVERMREFRRIDNESVFIASQITEIDTALAVEDAGANAIITGVGSGGRCTTADKAQSIPINALFPRLAYRAGLTIPIIGEGGAVDEPIIAALSGEAGVNGSGSLGGGVAEAPGGIKALRKNGKLYKPYGGEASPRTKWLSGRIYPTGEPYFTEGDQTFKEVDIRRISMTQRLLELQERLILGAVVLGVDKGPHTLEAIRGMDNTLFLKSETTRQLQGIH